MIENNFKESQNAILKIQAPDSKGIISKITGFLAKRGGNILELEQFVDRERNMLFMRVVWDLASFSIALDRFQSEFDLETGEFDIKWELTVGAIKDNLAIFVSQELHCLAEVLTLVQLGSLPFNVKAIISNHVAAKKLANQFEIPFYHFSFDNSTREEVEAKQLKVLEELNINLISLARYMRILSKEFIDQYRLKIINIHHSFLPAFAGAAPYRQAYSKGVKIIGATAHFATENLDEGPIIAQDVAKVNHVYSVDALIDIGKTIEKSVLTTSLKKYGERKIMVYGSRTVVFR
ncbi:MAG: formyltetrahydrofolate deformylase [Nitrospinota bacterium]